MTKEEFESRVRDALEAFSSKSLQKVVLARRVLMDLTESIDPAMLLRHVVGSTRKRQYMFIFEPCAGSAFVSLTPERLCKVHGADIWTEAVAGTWSLEDFNKYGEASLRTASPKHSDEHRIVVDFIRSVLGKVSKHVKVCDEHILRLRDLVHIKQSYHAIARPDCAAGDDPQNYALTNFFCTEMSPTPAVGGLPLDGARRFIAAAEPFDRGLYAAPCGVVSAKSSELVVAIRSCLVRNGRELHVYAGAGMVQGSDPAEEHAEISLKMRQFTAAFPKALAGMESIEGQVASLAELPNMNTLWSALVIEECIRLGVRNFVICPGSRSTPLVVAIARHPHATASVNHDERAAAFYALGWAKAIGAPVGVIVTSGTAVANLLPGVVEAAQSQVPLLLLTADRPAELRDTGANQTIVQPGIFGAYTRWAKDMPCPSVEFPAHALLSDIDLAVAHASGTLTENAGPVHLNFCFRENLAPDGGAVRGAPERTSSWSKSYVDTPQLHRWLESATPRSSYLRPGRQMGSEPVLQELVELARSGQGRVLMMVGSLRTAEEGLLVEDIARRLGAAMFADITSGLRQRRFAVNFADQALGTIWGSTLGRL